MMKGVILTHVLCSAALGKPIHQVMEEVAPRLDDYCISWYTFKSEDCAAQWEEWEEYCK